MTDESRQLPADSEPRLRETLRATLDGARAQLAANLAQLRSALHADSNLIAQGDAHLSALIALQGQIDTANPLALAMLNAAVTASVANASTLAQQVNEAVTATTREAAIQQLAAADKAARDAVTGFEKDYFERRIFDPYLRFSSKEEEEAFREREAERQRAIAEARAKGTPEGDLRAVQLSLAQLDDAGAHGAARSPLYRKMHDDLQAAKANLSEQIDAKSQAKEGNDRLALADAVPPTQHSADVLPVELIAKLQSSGLTTAESSAEGHGLAAKATTGRAGQSLA